MAKNKMQDPSETLTGWITKIKNWDSKLKEKSDLIYERKLSLTDPTVVRLNHVRQTFRFYLLPALEAILNTPQSEQVNFLKYMYPFSSEENLYRLLEHFYSIQIDVSEKISFLQRDEYEQDVFILYDLYKAKKTIEVLEILTNEIKQGGVAFPSRFKKEQQLALLKGFHGALLMTFKHSLKPEYQKPLYKEISADFIAASQIEKRRKKQLLYARPETPQGHPYRRIFLHILFRQNIKTQINNQETRFSYNLVHYEHLKREYLSHWVQQLKQHPAKMKVYQQMNHGGKSFAQWILEDPNAELNLLNDLPADAFAKAMDEIQDHVEAEKRSKIEPLSESSPIFKNLERNFQGFLDTFHTRLSIVSEQQEIPEVLTQLTSLSSELPQSLPDHSIVAENDCDVSALLEQWEPLHRIGKSNKETAKEILVLMPPALLSTCKLPLEKRLHARNLSAQITNIEKIHIEDFFKYRLILTWRCLLSSEQQEKTAAEIIDAEFPITQFSIPPCSRANKKNQARCSQLKQIIKENEQNPHWVAQFENELKIWLTKQACLEQTRKLEQAQEGYQALLPLYHTLLFWLIVEALEEAGHMKKLIHALLRVSPCLIIDGMGSRSIQYLASVGFDFKLLKTWKTPQLKKAILQFKENFPAGTLEDFLNQSHFDKYEVVFMVDWVGSTEQYLPSHLRIRQYSPTSAKSSTKILSFNLFDVFHEEIPFLKHCFNRLEKIQGIAEQISPSPLQLMTLRQKKFEENLLNEKIEKLTKYLKTLEEQQASLSKNLAATTFESSFQNHILDRIEFFILTNCLKSKG